MAAYDAFISYSHALDKPIAAALQTVVQRLGKPWYRRRSLRLFRDDTSLAASPHLWPSIEAALAQSRFLILLASPEAATSPWVGKEIEYWLAHKSTDTLLIALTGGTLAWDNDDFHWSASTPLPAVLKGRFASEPRWVDVSAYRGGAAPRDVRFMDLGADFAAAIHGMPKEDLLSLEVRQQRRALTLAWSAAASLLVLAGLAGWQWQSATAQRKRAENALTAAATTSDQLVYDLALKLRNRPGMPVELVREILGRVEGLQRQLSQGGETSAENRRLESIALGELSTTLREQGDAGNALIFAERARAISEAFVKADPNNPQYRRDLAVHLNTTGDAKVSLGQPVQALDDFQKALAIVQDLAAKEPDNATLQRDLTIGLTRIGGILAATGRSGDALEPFGKAVSILEGLAAREPTSPVWQGDLSSAYNRVGMALAESGKSAEALAAYRQSLALRQKLAAGEPDNTQRQRDVFLSQTRIGDLLAATGHPDDALPAYRDAQTAIERLALNDPGNLQWQDDLTTAYDHSGDMLVVLGNVDEALLQYRKSLAIREKLVGLNPAQTEWQYALAVSHGKVGEALLRKSQTQDAIKSFQSALAIARKLLDGTPDRIDWQRAVAVTLSKIGDAVIATDRTRARESYLDSLAIRRTIARQEPNDWERQRDLALLIERLANLDLGDGRFDDALTLEQEAYAIRERVAAADSNNLIWQEELFGAAGWMGIFHDNRKEPTKAVPWLARALAIGEQSVARSPKNTTWPARLLDLYERLGLILTQQDPTQAIEPLRKAVAIRSQAAAAAPTSVDLQRTLLLAQSYLATALVDAGRPGEALPIYRAALPIIEGYSSSAPEKTEYQIELVKCLTWLAALGDDPEAQYARALAILRVLAGRGALTPEQLEWIPNFEKTIAELPK